jgi:ribosomal protein L12E/L44/L45/RPP1/RPP2
MKRGQEKEVTEMVGSITTAAAAQPVAPAAPAASDGKKASEPKQQSSGGADTGTVHLSSTAQAQLSAI